MTRVLTDVDVTFVRAAVLAEINANTKGSVPPGTQPLEGVWEILLLHAVIPLLVSLTSSVLSEVVKGKMLSSLKRREAEEAIEKLLKRPLEPKTELEDECLVEMLHVLAPMGTSVGKVKQLYEAVKHHLEIEQR